MSSIRRDWIACTAKAPSDTCAIQPPAKFRFAKRNRSWSFASTDKSLFAITATCRSQRKNEKDWNATARSFHQLPTQKLYCTAWPDRKQLSPKRFLKCCAKLKAHSPCSF